MHSVPNFIIAGERRCGTTSLYHSLASHPDVWLHEAVDMNYFIEREITDARHWCSGRADSAAWNASNSPEGYAALFSEGMGFGAIGHKGADLLFWEPAHARIAAFLPSVKLIIILRDPVSRAWSHYWNEVGKCREWLPFDEALSCEDGRAASSDYAKLHLSYTARGNYAESLARLFRQVGRSRVHVVSIEELKSRPSETLRDIYSFLGVDPTRAPNRRYVRQNENWATVPRAWTKLPGIHTLERAYGRVGEALVVRLSRRPGARRKLRKYINFPFRRPASAIAMPANVRAALTEIYRPQMPRLQQLLGRPFEEWLR